MYHLYQYLSIIVLLDKNLNIYYNKLSKALLILDRLVYRNMLKSYNNALSNRLDIKFIKIHFLCFGLFSMKNYRPVIGITMGDPVGIGPEIIISAFSKQSIYSICRPIVIGDLNVLNIAKKLIKSDIKILSAKKINSGMYVYGNIDVINCSDLDPASIFWGNPIPESGRAMVCYVTTGIDMAMQGSINAVVTCPINKKAMEMAGSCYHGHTELFAATTKTDNYAMMLAGKRLKVVLVTIHVQLKDVPDLLSSEKIFKTITITNDSLVERFGIKNPKLAVAGLNPHAGENGMFGNEEDNIIKPAIDLAKNKGINVNGPFPPDTIFYKSVKGTYDAVICMYHDQGLIPFKLIHFKDGVNTTLGLPIIRTSVDHGTAYDIAGKGIADPSSLIAAINMAATQALSLRSKQTN